MKVLILSNAPWAPTGYGTQTAQLTERLAAAGHEVGVVAFYGLSGGILKWNGITVYPGGLHPYGLDVLVQRAHTHFDGDLRGGLVVTLVDVWVLDPAALSQMNVACWTPVDHDPCPPDVARALDASSAWPIAMSRFGERALAQAGFRPLYAPHAIDTTIFKPPDDKQATRRELGLPEQAFIVGMVAANKGYPPRKGFPEAVAAFADLVKTHDDAYLLLHTEPHGAVQGINIPALLSYYKIDPGRVSLSGPVDYTTALPAESMAQIIGSCDVLLNPSYGEGFGIPVLEAQACGVPAIVTDWTAMPEVGQVGWKVGGQVTFTGQRSFQKIPDIEQLAAALKSAYTQASRMGTAAREHALQYDADLVFEEHWVPLLADLEERCGTVEVGDTAELVAA